MSKFGDQTAPLAGKVKEDYDPNWQNLEPQAHELTNINSSDPHFIRFSITRLATVEEVQAGKPDVLEVANWAMKFPTRDAADSHCADIREEMKHMRGEPEQAWADVARLSKCPNPTLLPKFKNLNMELIPAQPNRSEPIPRDHPAYPNSFAAKRDAVTGVPHPEPGPASPGSPEQASSRPDGRGPKQVRARPAAAKGKLPGKRSSRKAAASKPKQSKAKTSRRRTASVDN